MIRRTVCTDEGGRFWYDTEAAEAGLAFFCERLTLTVAEWAGKPFIPDEWQAQTIRDLFGWKRTDDNTRRFRIAYIWVPRKAGKSEFAAGIALLLLLGDDEPAAEVYCIASTDDQARIVFNRATAMVVNSEELSDAMTPYANMIWYHDTGSKIQPLTGKPQGKHGLVAVGVIGDEMHEWSDDELYTFVHQSEGNRRQPLDFLISTAGKKEGPGWEMYKLSEQLLSGDVVDHSAYVVICSANAQRDKDDPEYWKTKEAWAEANPSYPVTPKHAYLEAECGRCANNPRLENNFKKYHLNLWVEQDVRWLNMTKWDECALSDWRTMAERLIGRDAVFGVDISAVRDLTASIGVFPPTDEDPLWRVLPRFFIPEARLEERVKTDRQPFDKWLAAGAVIATPGEAVDQHAIQLQLEADAEHFNIRAVMIDRWNAVQFATNLIQEGFEAELFGQGFGSMSAPSKFLEKLVLQGRIDHGGHPVLRWCAANVAVTEDAAENIKPAKDKSTDRIDGIVGTVMAIGGCDEHLTDDGGSWSLTPV